MFQPSSFLFVIFFTQFFVGYVDPHKIICLPGKTQFPNPYDRHSFYKCDAGGNPILFPCPAKTWFNPCLEVCDWDTGNYDCDKSGGAGKIICPPGKTQFPNPYDRHSFYKCDAGGNPILFPCPAKTWFNPCLEVCDWDTGNYNCGQSGGATSNPGSSGNGNTSGKHPSGPTNSGNGNSQNVININININGVQNEGNAGKPNGNRPQDQLIPPSHGGYRPQPNSPTTGGTTTANNQTYPSKLAPNQNCSTYGLLYQNPEDCSTYFMCNQRRLVLVHCTRGYFYIPERKRCETTYPTGCKFVEHNLGDSKPIYETENDVWQYQRSLKG